jgi:hypothetical protein
MDVVAAFLLDAAEKSEIFPNRSSISLIQLLNPCHNGSSVAFPGYNNSFPSAIGIF